MKKWMTLILTGLIAAMVASGCTANSAPPSGLPEAAELIDRISEAGKELKSFSTEEDVYQIIVNRVSHTASTEQIVDSLTRSDIIKEPFQMHSINQTKMHEDMSLEMEQYVTKDAIFMKLDSDWMKMNEELRVKAMPSMEEAGYPWRQLELYRPVQEALKVSEEGEHYVIRAELNDSQLLKFTESYRNRTNYRGEPLMDDYSDITIRKADIVYTVHKDTYYPVEISLSSDMDLTRSGHTYSIEGEMRSKYSNYNGIKEIRIPEEALSAQ